MYNRVNKGINAEHLNENSLSGVPCTLGDKEIAVKVRGNSHYRNSHPRCVKSECLSLCDA